ncbi:MAG: hypothetical protein CVV64_04660 [Candidatus Wallbacteria bacterium HGW-Wallbacteria-1]|jgi:SAM-dependent methyltransferase|uniref:Methyltransferase type 11 domain-containing protein n=1 Tax=Candidatus Wallbacteria bacterium HGW-Wallbacteria-1 TaxID=2013854 RepID=A0A2N1PRU2_9BACT|nr:MAG: hypothetical protein CVV64_04660 [Candidatus Wallbacteria bacterium HGW-Wallbacteria-1]
MRKTDKKIPTHEYCEDGSDAVNSCPGWRKFVDLGFRLARLIYSPPSRIPRDTWRNFSILLRWLRERARFSGDRDSHLVINLGSGRGGEGFSILARDKDVQCLCMDLKIDGGADVVADIHQVPIADSVASLVVLQAVLEHVPDPERVLSEAYRILMDGGVIYVEIPFMQGYHADPEDYRRLTGPGLKMALEKSGFEVVTHGPTGGPGAGLMAVVRAFLLGFFRKGILRHIATPVVRWATLPLLMVDMAYGHRKNQVVAPGFYAMGVKSHNSLHDSLTGNLQP